MILATNQHQHGPAFVQSHGSDLAKDRQDSHLAVGPPEGGTSASGLVSSFGPTVALQRAGQWTTMAVDDLWCFEVGRSGRCTLFLGSKPMYARQTWFGSALGFFLVVTLVLGLTTRRAEAQKGRSDQRYEYKVVCFTYNPGERLNDDARAARFQRLLNDYARDGWEPVIDFLNRSSVQTVGGAVTTRDSITFIAFRRLR
jgi:hypothetical protein